MATLTRGRPSSAVSSARRCQWFAPLHLVSSRLCSDSEGRPVDQLDDAASLTRSLAIGLQPATVHCLDRRHTDLADYRRRLYLLSYQALLLAVNISEVRGSYCCRRIPYYTEVYDNMYSLVLRHAQEPCLVYSCMWETQTCTACGQCVI